MPPIYVGDTLVSNMYVGADAVAALFNQGDSLLGAAPLPNGYNIIIAAGQSNMVGQSPSTGADTTADTLGPGSTQLVKMWGTSRGLGSYGTIVSGVDPITLGPQSGINSGNTSPCMQFARAYAAATGKKTLVVHVACSNTSLTLAPLTWQYTATLSAPTYTANVADVTANNLYRNMIYEANLAVAAAVAADSASAVVGLLWIQGENDGGGYVMTAAYKTALSNLVDGFRAQVTGAANSWFVMGSMLPEAIYTEPETYGNYQGYRKIHQAHKLLPATKARSAFARGSFGYSDRAADTGAGQLGAIHYKLRAGVVDLGQRMYAASQVARLRSTGESVAAPAAPTIRTIAGTSSTSIRIGIDRDYSQGNTDLVVQYSLAGANSWTTYYDGTSGVFATGELCWIAGLSASTSYDVRVADKNSVGTSAYSTAGTASTTASATGYDFEADTVGAAPIGITSFAGKMTVASAPAVTPNGGNAAYAKCMTPTGTALGGVIWDAWLDKIPVAQDRTVVIRVGKANASNSGQIDIILRAQPDTMGEVAQAGEVQGYRFLIDYTSVRLELHAVTSTGVTTIIAPAFFGQKTDQMYRVSAIGVSPVTLKFEYSGNDGGSWTTFGGVQTDSANLFKSGGVQVAIRDSGLPLELFIDSITWS
jgi:hypothetical protein